MTDSTTTAARAHLRHVTEDQVKAMTEADPTALREATEAVARIVADARLATDVAEHAGIIVASFLVGASSPLHAARYAIATARRVVATVAANDALPASDTEVMGDALESGKRSTLSHWGQAPDFRHVTSRRDIVRTAVRMSPAGTRATLARAVAAYLTHAQAVADGQCCTGAGRRVTLAGILAHVENMSEAQRKASGRAVGHATGWTLTHASDVLDALDGDPLAPAHARHSRVTGGDCHPITGTPANPHRVDTGLVTVRMGDTVTRRRMTEVEAHAADRDSDAPTPRASERERGTTSPYGPAMRRGGEVDGMVLSRKPVVSPRKRSGTGSTGPTVPAW